eukprot:scaffold1243_cov403-Prasinococcus_capsulatus_cf.AAC.4
MHPLYADEPLLFTNYERVLQDPQQGEGGSLYCGLRARVHASPAQRQGADALAPVLHTPRAAPSDEQPTRCVTARRPHGTSGQVLSAHHSTCDLGRTLRRPGRIFLQDLPWGVAP